MPSFPVGPLFMLFAVLAWAPTRIWGQKEGSQQWGFSAAGIITTSSPALSPDGMTVYVGVVTGTGGRVLAVAREGGSRWGKMGQVFTSAVDSSPAVAPDGTVYVGCVDGNLYALNPADGKPYWACLLGGFISSSPAIGRDGTVYVGASDGKLYAVAPNGGVQWSFRTGASILSSPAIASDGTIYFGSEDKNVYALTPAGLEKWRFATSGSIFSSPAIGLDGTVYVGSADQRMYALSPDGQRKWDYLTNGRIDASPVLGADGTIYFAADRSMYALRPGLGEERLRWKADLNTTSGSSAAIRADGTIIFGADDGYVRALNPSDGSKRWQFPLTPPAAGDYIESSPLVAPDGSIYVGSVDGNLYKINGNGSPLSAYSSWPGFHGGVRHTAQATATNTGAQLVNIATRAQAGGGSKLVAGFVVQGSSERTYLIRAVGPGLKSVGINGFLSDPRMDFYAERTLVRVNDNWREPDDTPGFSVVDTSAAVGAFPLEVGSKDAAMVPYLLPGLFTADVTSADGASGVALVEVYDARAGDATGRIINLSTRGQVGTGDNLLIAGLVVGGTGTMRLLLRGIGPALTQFGVSGALVRPRIEVFRGPLRVGSNTGWMTDGYKGDLSAAAAAVAAFALSETSNGDSAMLFTAEPGEYTLQISGVEATSGEAMVEVYVLP